MAMHGRKRLLPARAPPSSGKRRHLVLTLAFAAILILVYWRLDAAKQVTSRAKVRVSPSKRSFQSNQVVKANKQMPASMEIDESEEEEHPDMKPSHQVHVASEDEDLPSQQDATTHTTDAEARVPVVRHPEFVFGGKWARTKHEAVSTSDSPTEACHATTILHLDKKQVLMAWFGGTYEGAEDVGIWVSKRDESGWEYPHLAAKVFRDAPYRGKNLKGNGPYNKAEPPRQGREPHWNPVLWCSGAGRGDGDGAGYGVCKGEIILYFKIGWKIPEWETYVTKSNDQGLSWSTPTPLFEHDKGGRGPVKNKNILLSDGSWLAPASLEGPKPGVGRRRVWRAFVDASDDHGETWVKVPGLLDAMARSDQERSLYQMLHAIDLWIDFTFRHH